MVSVRRPFKALADPDPREIGRYQILAHLGAGAFGTVYLGRDEDGELAAVKVVHPAMAADPAFRDRFRREVELGMRVRSQFTTRFLAADVDAPRDGPQIQETGHPSRYIPLRFAAVRSAPPRRTPERSTPVRFAPGSIL